MTYSLEKIAALTGAHLVGEHERQVSWLLTDSRSLCFPESSLFFAIRSQRNDGHRYLSELYRRGVRAFVVSQLPADLAPYAGAGFLLVKSPVQALQRLAERHREEFNIPVVGITGSNGKTMVKEWLYQLLSDTYRVTRSPRSYNSQIGVPLSVWQLSESTQVGLFEAGISQPGEMAALQSIVQPTIGVFTCLGDAHGENFSSPQQKCQEKLRLFKDARTLVYCIDDPLLSGCVSLSSFKGEYLAWSMQRTDVALSVQSVEKADGYARARYIYKGMEGSYRIPFIDDASVTDSLHCLAVCLSLGLHPDTIAARMERLEPVAMRLEVVEGQRGCTLINDSYNSDLNSLDIALNFMQRRPEGAGRRHTLILSDMEQTGLPPAECYAQVARLVASRGVDAFVGVGQELCAHRHLFAQGSRFFATTAQLLGSDLPHTLSHEVVLIKGARTYGFDRLTALLSQRVHQTTLEVNLGAVVDNLNYYRSFMHPDTKMACMVKASAYGAGAIEIAKTLQDHRVDYLAVAVADEGVELRQAGITAGIMVMNPEMNALRTLFEYQLEPEVYSFRLLEALLREAHRMGVEHYPIHIKLDTGMHRLGFDPQHDMERLLQVLGRQTALIPRSVFSHFVGSDSDDFDTFSARQFQLFMQGSDALRQVYGQQLLRHICNSAGIEHFPQRQLEMVRLGLGLYGINARNNQMLHNVSTLKTTILQIHQVPKDDTVGYSRKGHLTRDSRIATLPIGYADGLDRGLGCGRGYCLVNGQRAPYVGNICMDVCMVDVTDIDCDEGDTAVIFGDDLPVTALSDAIGTIPYEVLTGVSPRVKRIYFQD